MGCMGVHQVQQSYNYTNMVCMEHPPGHAILPCSPLHPCDVLPRAIISLPTLSPSCHPTPICLPHVTLLLFASPVSPPSFPLPRQPPFLPSPPHQKVPAQVCTHGLPPLIKQLQAWQGGESVHVQGGDVRKAASADADKPYHVDELLPCLRLTVGASTQE